MLNIDVALNFFWQFARHWKNCDTSKPKLSCEIGNLQMTMTSKLGLPDKLHFRPPLPDPFVKSINHLQWSGVQSDRKIGFKEK